MIGRKDTLAGLAAMTMGGMTVNGAQLLTNGNFESIPLGTDSSTTTFPNWSEKATPGAGTLSNSVTTNGTGGGLQMSPANGNTAGNAAYIIPGTGTNVLLQGVSMAQGSTWQFDVDLAMVDPGLGGLTGQRGFHVQLFYQTPTAGNFCLSLRVNGDGDINVYGQTASAWKLVNGLGGAVVFSDDFGLGQSAGDGLLNPNITGSEDVTRVNHLRIIGDYSGTPTYAVSVTKPNGTTLNSDAAFVPVWQGTAAMPGPSGSFKSVTHVVFAGTSSAKGYVVDNASLVSPIPEPAAAGLLGLGALVWAGRRRRVK